MLASILEITTTVPLLALEILCTALVLFAAELPVTEIVALVPTLISNELTIIS